MDKAIEILKLLKKDYLTIQEGERLIAGLMKYVNKYKGETEKNTKEVKQALNNTLEYLEEEHTKLKEDVKLEANKKVIRLENKVQEVLNQALDALEAINNIEIRDGNDGYTPIKGVDYDDGKDGSPDTAEQVRDKLELLQDDERLDASAIKGLDFVKQEDLTKAISAIPKGGGGSGGIEVFNSTGKVGSGSALKFIGSGVSTISNDGHTTTVNITGGGGGGAWGSITGTLSDQTDLQTALDAKLDGNGTATYIPFYSDVNTLTSDAHFTYDSVNDVLHTHKLAGDATDGLIIESANGTDVGILGAGNTANATWYGSHNYDAATANTIASFGASKTLSSLATATYPDLTELSYVKGVTSAIQTQLNAKQAIDTQLTSLAGLSYTGNGGKFIRVNAGETDFELATVGGSGTVTSVAMTVPTGLTVSGSPVTTSGTLAVALDTGYIIPLQTTLDGYVKTDQTVGQTIGTTGARLTKLWATDITATNAIAGSITGNAATVTNATLTTALTVNTGTVTLTGNVANSSVLTIGAGAVSVSGSNTGDVTVSDSAEIDFTLTGQQISASLVAGSIDETKLDASVNASLDLADSALQASAIGTTVQAYDADLTTWAGITPGTGVGTALAVNVGTAGAFVVNGGALGTPSSGTVTNLTGTASININGTVGATTPTTVVGTTINATTGFRVNGAATSRKILVGDGTNMVLSTETYAVPGTSGNVLTSDGTNWTSAAPSGGFTWTEVTGTSQSAAVNNGYIANNAGLVTVTIPTTAAVGSIVRVTGKGAGLWKLAQNASEIIHFGSTDTTTGTGGSITATNRYDCIEIQCIVADTEWVVLSSVGNLTVV